MPGESPELWRTMSEASCVTPVLALPVVLPRLILLEVQVLVSIPLSLAFCAKMAFPKTTLVCCFLLLIQASETP